MTEYVLFYRFVALLSREYTKPSKHSLYVIMLRQSLTIPKTNQLGYALTARQVRKVMRVDWKEEKQ